MHDSRQWSPQQILRSTVSWMNQKRVGLSGHCTGTHQVPSGRSLELQWSALVDGKKRTHPPTDPPTHTHFVRENQWGPNAHTHTHWGPPAATRQKRGGQTHPHRPTQHTNTHTNTRTATPTTRDVRHKQAADQGSPSVLGLVRCMPKNSHKTVMTRTGRPSAVHKHEVSCPSPLKHLDPAR